MVRCAIGVYLVECILCRRLEGGIVIQHVRFIGVDVPVSRTGHLTEEGCVGESVIKIASLSIKGIGVSVRAMEVCDEVSEIIGCANCIVGASLDLINRVFHGIGVQVTDDAMLVERIGTPVYVIDGERTNFKITVREDVWLAETLIREGRVP